MGADDAALLRLWLSAVVGSIAGITARLGWRLFGETAEPPPDDARAASAWRRRRLWIALAELAAVPAFAFGWTQVAVLWRLGSAEVALGALLTGSLGVAFVLDAVRRLTWRRVVMEGRDGS